MYKKVKIELVGSNISYREDKVVAACEFKMTDPSHTFEHVNEEGETEIRFRAMGNYNVSVKFEADAEPTKADILAAVNDLDGIVSTY